MTFNPSPQQLDIFSAIALGDSNLIVDAKAGTGKTTTIVHGMSHIPRGDSLIAPSVVFLAFNKGIADTLRTRIPRQYTASTFHSLGLRALKDSGIVGRNVEVVGGKCRKLVWNALDRDDPDTNNIVRLVGLFKSTWPEPEEWEWRAFVDSWDEPLEERGKAAAVSYAVVEASNRDRDKIDFDDMLYMPVKFDASFDKYDWMFIDEAQDTNNIQLEILERSQKALTQFTGEEARGANYSSTRLVFVGDPHQAIYAFRGANHDSMQRIARRFSCKTFPLSVSYRCPKAVVVEANKYIRQ